MPRTRRMTLSDLASVSYRPRRGAPETLVDALACVGELIACNPLLAELRGGSLKGRGTSKASGLQVLASGAACMALCAVAILVGS